MSVLFTSVNLASSTEPGTGLMHGNSRVSKQLARILRYFPHSPDGEACFKKEKARSPGTAHQQPPLPGTLPVKVSQSLVASPVKYREGEGV